MTVLAQIRAQGFTLKPVVDGLYIEPIDALTEAQRQWLIVKKPELRVDLIAERWQWFLSLASEHGIHPHVAGAGGVRAMNRSRDETEHEATRHALTEPT